MDKIFTIVITHEPQRTCCQSTTENVKVMRISAMTPWGAINKARAEYDSKGYSKTCGKIKNINCTW